MVEGETFFKNDFEIFFFFLLKYFFFINILFRSFDFNFSFYPSLTQFYQRLLCEFTIFIHFIRVYFINFFFQGFQFYNVDFKIAVSFILIRFIFLAYGIFLKPYVFLNQNKTEGYFNS